LSENVKFGPNMFGFLSKMIIELAKAGFQVYFFVNIPSKREKSKKNFR